MAQEKKQETRIMVEAENGQPVWIPASQAEAFREGQQRRKQGERPKDAQQRSSAILSKLLGSKK